MYFYIYYTLLNIFVLTNDGFIWFFSTFSIKIKVATEPEQVVFGIEWLLVVSHNSERLQNRVKSRLEFTYWFRIIAALLK